MSDQHHDKWRSKGSSAWEWGRFLRVKRTFQIELDPIEGIGRNRTEELLEAFDSVKGVTFATQEQ